MSILVTVNIEADADVVGRVEEQNPDVMAVIERAAEKCMTGHRRTTREGRVMDLDEFASKEDYDRFIAEAGGAIKQYGDLIGAAPVDTLWEVA